MVLLKRFFLVLVFAASILAVTSVSYAMVQSVEVTDRVVIPEYNGIPATEKLTGIVNFSFQVGNPYNSQIVDLDKAPVSMGQMVTAKANFMVLQPLNPDKRSGVALLEVSNRGGKAALRYFNLATSSKNPSSPLDLGDGLIQKQGLTLIWVGWQYDVPKQPDNLYAEIPRTLANHNITGLVRSDWVVNENSKRLKLGHRNMPTIYLPDTSSKQQPYLTRRKSRDGVRELVPTISYSFSGDSIVANTMFESGFIYELVYPARDPYIAGLGLAMIRDMMAYAKFNKDARFKVDKGIAFGVSQTGRFLRHFLYQGFNVAEDGRTVFDGMIIHTAGAGRGSFNHRFAQPSRDAHRFSAFYYPTDVFPYSSAEQTHPVTGQSDSLLKNLPANHQPKIFYTNTGYEYWGRAAGFVHSALNEQRDLSFQDNERYYHFAGTQHFQMPLNDLTPQPDNPAIFRGNSLNFFYYLRSLLTSMKAWVSNDKTPPASVYPRHSDASLIAKAQYKLPGKLHIPTPHTVYLTDYGESWVDGIIEHQPPKLLAQIEPPVPNVDELGNELGGIRHPLIMVPIASIFPWNLRVSGFQPNEMSDFYGTTIPFDSEMLYQLYRSKNDYVQRIAHAANNQFNNGYLLKEDVDRVVRDADQFWDWVKRVGIDNRQESRQQNSAIEREEATTDGPVPLAN